jgi:probable HAF family extracellular repeat protein
MKCSIMLAVVLVAVLAAECLSASYSFKQLDSELGSYGSGINNKGQVVGQSGDMGPAVLYSGGMKLPITPGEGHGLDINENGQIVGGIGFSTPFLYSGGTLKELVFPGLTDVFGEARAINNNGDVVGFERWGDGNGTITNGAFLYAGGAMQLLDANGMANDINDKGQIVGVFTDGFLYSDGIFRNPATLPGAVGYEGRAINENGDIAGVAYFAAPGADHFHAFAYIDGVMHDLGHGEANGINELGQVVGTFFINDDLFPRPFLYSSGALYNLGELTTPQLLVGADRISEASAINDAGQITGAFLGGGDVHTILLTPLPEPSSFVLAALGLIGLVVWG